MGVRSLPRVIQEQNCGKNLGLIPPRVNPRTACLIEKVCGIFVANSADYAGFADSADL
jgi:hypothetical protein